MEGTLGGWLTSHNFFPGFFNKVMPFLSNIHDIGGIHFFSWRSGMWQAISSLRKVAPSEGECMLLLQPIPLRNGTSETTFLLGLGLFWGVSWWVWGSLLYEPLCYAVWCRKKKSPKSPIAARNHLYSHPKTSAVCGVHQWLYLTCLFHAHAAPAPVIVASTSQAT